MADVHWKVGQLLGQGSYSSVYEIEPIDPDQVVPPVVVKILHSSIVLDPDAR